MEHIQICLSVCIKLHNLCKDEFLCNRFGFLDPAAEFDETLYPHPKLPSTFNEFLSKMPDGVTREFDNDDEDGSFESVVDSSGMQPIATRVGNAVEDARSHPITDYNGLLYYI